MMTARVLRCSVLCCNCYIVDAAIGCSPSPDNPGRRACPAASWSKQRDPPNPRLSRFQSCFLPLTWKEQREHSEHSVQDNGDAANTRTQRLRNSGGRESFDGGESRDRRNGVRKARRRRPRNMDRIAGILTSMAYEPLFMLSRSAHSTGSPRSPRQVSRASTPALSTLQPSSPLPRLSPRSRPT